MNRHNVSISVTDIAVNGRVSEAIEAVYGH